VEILLDKYDRKLIFKLKNLQFEVPFSQIDHIEEGIILKKFFRGFYKKEGNTLLGFFTNFGLNYFYYINLKENFKTVNIKLKNFFINYIVISVPKELYFLLIKTLEKV